MPEQYTRLVQIIHPENGRRVALVNDGELHLLSTYRTVYAFALAALDMGHRLRDLLSADLSGIMLDYDEVYGMRSSWEFLPSFDHPNTLSACVVSGSENGAPGAGDQPAFPPWFFKGNGMHLRGHGEPLRIPSFAAGGSVQPEVASLYVIDREGKPRRVGLSTGNQFSDPALAEQDARMLGHSKLRNCSLGPELVLDAQFSDISGSVKVERGGQELWSSAVGTGEAHAVFPLSELERRLFQYETHRIPGDTHVHFLGGSVSSHSAGVELQNGDEIVVEFAGFGRALRNPVER